MRRRVQSRLGICACLLQVPLHRSLQIAEVADGVYLGAMDYADKTGIAAMPSARHAFNNPVYRESIAVGMLKSEA